MVILCVLRRMVNDDVDAATAAIADGDDDADTHVSEYDDDDQRGV